MEHASKGFHCDSESQYELGYQFETASHHEHDSQYDQESQYEMQSRDYQRSHCVADSHHGEDFAHENQSQQLLPLTCSTHSGANSVRSQCASIAEISSLRTPDLGEEVPQWMPFALQWYFIMITAGLAVTFAIIVPTLYWHSRSSNGLCPEVSAMPGWKFVPTLIAVVYTQLTAMILAAIKRTEPFARMARPAGHIPIAQYTLLERPKPWWTTLAQGFQKRRNGGSWNWPIISSCIVYILAILGISPMSAALLSARDTQRVRAGAFKRVSTLNDTVLQPRAERSTYLRTMSATFQNYSTSPWVTTDYIVLPFWSADASIHSVWDPQIPETETWETDTIILRNEFTCTELHTKKREMFLRHATVEEAKSWNQTYMVSVLWESDNGCQFNFTANATGDVPASWGPRFSSDWASWDAIKDLPVTSLNKSCHEDEIILMSTPWWPSSARVEILANLTIKAYACHHKHTMATIPVRAAGTPTGVSIQFDKDLYHRAHTPVSASTLNLTGMSNMYNDVPWSQFVAQHSDLHEIFLMGPAAVLGARHKFNISEMMSDPNLLSVAADFRQRFFTEVISTSLQFSGASQEGHTSGLRSELIRTVSMSGQAASVLCTLLVISFCLLLTTLRTTRKDMRTLNVESDPSALLGLSVWASGSASFLSKFSTFDLATRKMLKAEFSKRLVLTEPGKIHEIESDSRTSKKAPANSLASDVSPILPALRLRNLVCLLLYSVGLFAGIVVLFEFARRSDLHQAFFTYRADIKLFGSGSAISPFAVVPTVLAIIVTLWWDSVDTTCRTIQPYVSMYRKARHPTGSIGLSYVSCFWLWASLKALKRRHWLLSLVTMTTFLVQILTIAMSALFDSGSGVVTRSSTIDQTLELRQAPHVQKVSKLMTYGDWANGFDLTSHGRYLLGDMFYDLKSDWLYTAIIEAALRGPTPIWSKDDWSFVPSLRTFDTESAYYTSEDSKGQTRFSTNVTVLTPAIRARLECSAVSWSSNTSRWLEAHKITDWFYDNEPKNVSHFNITDLDDIYYPVPAIYDGNMTTRITAQANYPRCCANSTADMRQSTPYNPAVIAYWTENWGSAEADGYSSSGLVEPTGNFTIKWIRGPASFVEFVGPRSYNLFFPKPPAIQALNCMPSFEASEARVTVDPASGVVQQYQILDSPLREDVAWSDAFQWRNMSGNPGFRNDSEWKSIDLDVTTSYGIIFMKLLLRAASLDMVNSQSPELRNVIRTRDLLEDKVFNMRDNTTGLNIDFMSYAAYAQVGFDPTALLDSETLLRTSQNVFSTFFKHFVHHNISYEHGGWVYQPIGQDFRVNPPVVNMPIQYTPDGSVAPRFEDVVRKTNRTATVTISTRIEVLRMDSTAFWISSSILVWLAIVIIVLASVQRTYYGKMMRNVECIADVLVLIAGSDRLLAVIKERGIDTILKEDKILTRLGWFRDPDGMMRWRIELVEDEQVKLRPIRLGTSYVAVPGEGHEDENILPPPAEDAYPGPRNLQD